MIQGYLAFPIAERHGKKEKLWAKMCKHSSYELTKVTKAFTKNDRRK